MPDSMNIGALPGVGEMLASAVAKKKSYVYPRWAEDGMRVLIPYPTPEKPRQGLWCEVAVAAGNHARVVNPRFGIDRWFPLEDLLVPSDDPHA